MSITLSIDGMTCGHCVSAVKEEVGEIAGVDDVTVDLVAGGTSTATVETATDITDQALTDAIDEAGYTLKEVARS